jgi:NAD(P)-dependent dehydrogenase (short-subunit alcohol dehydrogenase family)
MPHDRYETATVNGAVVLVTGATRGVGRGVARELARQGARVFVTGRSVPNHSPFDEPVTAIRCDHRHDDDVEAACDRVVAGRLLPWPGIRMSSATPVAF